MLKKEVSDLLKEAENHLVNELLPFWTKRIRDEKYGGFITHLTKPAKIQVKMKSL